MVNVIVNKDSTLDLTPLIANVSDKGVVESLYIAYEKQIGTLLYLIYTDDYDATHTKLVSANNTVSLNSYKSSSLRIQLKSINAASGEVVFRSEWATLQLDNVEKGCDCEHLRPPMFEPGGPHTPPPHHGLKPPHPGPEPPHHGFKPPKNCLYDFYLLLNTALEAEITTREQGDEKLAEMITSGNSTMADTVSEVIDKVEANTLAIEKLQKKRVVGFATMKPLVDGGTSQLKLAYVGDLIVGTNYTYTLKRGDIEVISWQKQDADDTSSSVTVATPLLISGGNTIVIKDGEELVCEAELEIYNLNETIMLQLVAYSE